MKTFKKESLWLALFIAIVGIFFYPTILKGKLPVPSDSLIGLYHPWRDFYAAEYPRGIPFKNFLITDPVRQQIPWRKIVIDQWKEGGLPRWNPFSFSGTPLSANIQSGTFYPLNVLFFVLPFPIAWTALIILQPILAGIFLYLFLRQLKLGQWASLFGAIIWSFSGFNVSWLTWGTMVHTALWLPLALWAIDKKNPYLLVFALVSMIFAGHIQIALYLLVLIAFYAISRRANIRLLSWAGIATIFITSQMWLSFIKLISQAGRLTEFDTWKQTGWFLPWQHLAQFIAPDFFGNPSTLNYWGVWNYGEFIGYIGIIGLILVFVSFLFKNRETRFWKITLFVSLIFLLPNPISKLPYQLHVPVFSSLQPTRLMVLVCFSLAILASYGFDHLLRQNRKLLVSVLFPGVVLLTLWTITIVIPGDNMAVTKRNLVLPTILFALSAVSLYLPKNIFAFTAVALIVFDLLRFAWKFTPFTDQKYFFPQTAAIKFLETQKRPFRIASVDSRILPPNTSSYFGIESIEGYDPIYLRSYEEFIAATERGKPDIAPPYGFNRIITPHAIDSPLFPLLGARYVLSLTDLHKPYLTKVFQEGETKIYEDSRANPRAYIAEEVRYEGNRADILHNLFASQNTKMAFVEQPISLVSAPLMTNETVELTQYREGSLTINVQVENPRLLVISNIFYPGWVATLDGGPVEIMRTNYLFQGVVIPSGAHTIILQYRN